MMFTKVYKKKRILVNKSILSAKIKRWYNTETVCGYDFYQIKLLVNRC